MKEIKYEVEYGVSVFEGNKKVAEYKFKTKEEMEAWVLEKEVSQIIKN